MHRAVPLRGRAWIQTHPLALPIPTEQAAVRLETSPLSFWNPPKFEISEKDHKSLQSFFEIPACRQAGG